MNTAEIRELTNEELVEALKEAKEEKFNLRFQVATNQLDNTARLKAVKKDIARICTVLRERELAPASSEADEAGKESA
jgi:large subunit ribosomal protein L29